MANVLALPGSGSKYKAASAVPAGFLAGVWHGLLIIVIFLISLFTDRVRIYETQNRGRSYDFGFLLGIGLLGPVSIWIGPYQLL